MGLTLAITPICKAENLDVQIIDRALEDLKKLQILSEKGINVSKLVEELNEVVMIVQRGDLESARIKLVTIEDEILKLEAEADRYYIVSTIMRYAKVVGILVIPIIFYLLFPRIYLYIWFRSRRRWVLK